MGIVLTEPGLGVIIDAIYISRKIFKRMKNYVTYRIACTIQLLLFFFVAILAIHPNASRICLSTIVYNNPNPGINHYNASICDGDVALATFPTLAKNYSTVDALNQLPVCEDSINSYNSFCKCVIKNGKGINDFNVGLPGDDCNPSYFKIPVIALVLIT